MILCDWDLKIVIFEINEKTRDKEIKPKDNEIK